MTSNSLLRKGIEFWVYSGAHIGFGAACLTFLTLELTGHTSRHFYYILFTGGATAALYTGHRLIGRARMGEVKQPESRFEFVARYLNFIRLACLAWMALTLFALVYLWDVNLMLWLLPGAIIAGLYVLPVFPGRRRLRDFGWGKILLIGISWGWLTAFVPLLILSDSSVQLSLFHGIDRMAFVILLTIPFDIRDMTIDRASGLINLPARIGPVGIRQLALRLCLIVAFCSGLTAFHYLQPSYVIAMTLISLSMMFLIRKSYQQQDDLYFSGGIDGLMMAVLLLFLLLNVFL